LPLGVAHDLLQCAAAKHTIVWKKPEAIDVPDHTLEEIQRFLIRMCDVHAQLDTVSFGGAPSFAE
jgi:hypothetical protein